MQQLIVYSFGAGVATLMGALLVLARKDLSENVVTRLMGFGSGVLWGAAFLHLVPGSVERSPLGAGWAMLVSILLFVAIEQFIHAHSHPYNQQELPRAGAVGIMAFIALFVHSLVDGIAIAAGLRASADLGLAAAIAVIAHEVPEGLISVSLFTAAGYRRKWSVLLSCAVALATPFGALVSWYWTEGVDGGTLAVLLGLAAGSFIYVATADILPRLHEERDVRSFLYVFVGVAIPVVLLLLE